MTNRIFISFIFLMIFCSNSFAAFVQITGFETGDASECSVFSGTASIQSTVKRTGSYSLQVNPVTTGVGAARLGIVEADGTNGDGSPAIGATVWLRFYFRIGTLPAANSEEFLSWYQTTGSTRNARLEITSSGTINAFDTVGQVGTGATVLSLNTWYLLEAKMFRSATVGVVELKINGTQEFTTSVANTSANGCGRIGFGKATDRNSQTINLYYDDIAISDSGYMGAGQCKALTVNANGTTQQWTSGTGASDYTQVDEVPFSNTDYVQSPGVGGEVALFSFLSTGTVGITGTINSAKLVIRTRENATGTSATKARISSSGTTLDNASALDGTTTTITQNVLAVTDPNTGLAWTTGGLDSVQGGAIEANAIAVRCSSVIMMVDYVPLNLNSDFLKVFD